MKRVLFACVGNSFRSQIAEGFARALARPGTVDARSGGTAPFGHVHPKAVRLMTERGIDISTHTSKSLDLAFAAQADAFVTLCGPLDESCPAALASKAIPWDVGDPGHMGPEGARRMRDDIEARVRSLLSDLGVMKEGA